MKKIDGLLEKVSEMILLIEASDLPALAEMHTLFTDLSKLFHKHKYSMAAPMAEKNLELIENIMKSDSSDPGKDLNEIRQNLSKIQQSCRKKDNGQENPEKAEEKIAEAPGPVESSPAKKEERAPIVKPSFLGDSIFQEFLQKQDMVLERMEELSMELEQKGFQETKFNDLLRIIHTLKGEAGVLDLVRLEEVAHTLESYLQKKKEKFSAEVVLKFKDWLLLALIEFRKGIVDVDGHAILEYIKSRTEEVEEKKEVQEEEMELTEEPGFCLDFVNESREHLEQAENALLKVEAGENIPDNINKLFRGFHTIKGIAGFLHLKDICALTHEAESLFDKIRNKQIHMSPLSAETSLKVIDKLKVLISGVEIAAKKGGKIKIDKEIPQMVEILQKLQRGEIGFEVQVTKKEEASPEEHKEGGAIEAQAQSTGQDDSIRIQIDKLDRIVNMIGELVISHSMVGQLAEKTGDPLLQKNMEHMKKITSELQEISMTLRLVPLKSTFLKMSRVVRDVARKMGKQVELVISGEDTELDKSMVDKLNDPLVHMIRNSVDHGIEDSAEDRKKKGKNPLGRVDLKAYHKGGNICIEIADDGKGVNREAILKKAIEKGLAKPEDNLTENEIFNFMFAPGFSTAKVVTEVSGRGVGMDVVKRNIESLRGKIDISSAPDKGTTFIVRLPLTLAIIDGMIIRVGKERYILPTLSILNSFRPKENDISTILGKGETFKFLGHIVSLVRLGNLFHVEHCCEKPQEGLIVVVENDGRTAGLLVDELLGQQEIVIKNLGDAFTDTPGVTGGAILPDGTVGLILDIAGIIKAASV